MSLLIWCFVLRYKLKVVLLLRKMFKCVKTEFLVRHTSKFPPHNLTPISSSSLLCCLVILFFSLSLNQTPIVNVNLAHFDHLYNWKLQYDDDRFERCINLPANLCSIFKWLRLRLVRRAIQSNYYVNLSTHHDTPTRPGPQTAVLITSGTTIMVVFAAEKTRRDKHG